MNTKNDEISRILSDEKRITKAMQRAVREAVETHKRAGNPIAVWKDGKVAWVKAKNCK